MFCHLSHTQWSSADIKQYLSFKFFSQDVISLALASTIALGNLLHIAWMKGIKNQNKTNKKEGVIQGWPLCLQGRKRALQKEHRTDKQKAKVCVQAQVATHKLCSWAKSLMLSHHHQLATWVILKPFKFSNSLILRWQN